MPKIESAPHTDPNPFQTERLRSRRRYGDKLIDAIEASVTEEMQALAGLKIQKGEAAPVLTAGPMPILAGKGYEHLVFEVPVRNDPEKIRRVVVKVNVRKTLDDLRYEDVVNNDLEDGIAEMDREMEEREEALEELREYFGSDAVPRQRFYVADVPVSERLIDAVDPGWIPKDEPFAVKTMPAWVEVQQRVELDPKKTVSLNGGYLEGPASPLGSLERDEAARAYAVAHEVLTGLTDLSLERQRFITLQLYPNLRDIAGRMRDAGFASALKDTVRALIRYSEDTGIPLDLAGSNNLVLTKTDMGWRPRLLDVMPIGDFEYKDLATALHAAKDGKRFSDEIASAVYNGMNTIRVINALAIIAGVPERLREEAIDHASAAGWHEIMTSRTLSPPHTRKAA